MAFRVLCVEELRTRVSMQDRRTCNNWIRRVTEPMGPISAVGSGCRVGHNPKDMPDNTCRDSIL